MPISNVFEFYESLSLLQILKTFTRLWQSSCGAIWCFCRSLPFLSVNMPSCFVSMRSQWQQLLRLHQWIRPGPFWTTTVAWAIVAVAVVFVASYERRIYHQRGQLNEQPGVTGVIVRTQLSATDFCPFQAESLQIYYITDTVSQERTVIVTVYIFGGGPIIIFHNF